MSCNKNCLLCSILTSYSACHSLRTNTPASTLLVGLTHSVGKYLLLLRGSVIWQDSRKQMRIGDAQVRQALAWRIKPWLLYWRAKGHQTRPFIFLGLSFIIAKIGGKCLAGGMIINIKRDHITSVRHSVVQPTFMWPPVKKHSTKSDLNAGAYFSQTAIPLGQHAHILKGIRDLGQFLWNSLGCSSSRYHVLHRIIRKAERWAFIVAYLPSGKSSQKASTSLWLY